VDALPTTYLPTYDLTTPPHWTGRLPVPPVTITDVRSVYYRSSLPVTHLHGLPIHYLLTTPLFPTTCYHRCRRFLPTTTPPNYHEPTAGSCWNVGLPPRPPPHRHRCRTHSRPLRRTLRRFTATPNQLPSRTGLRLQLFVAGAVTDVDYRCGCLRCDFLPDVAGAGRAPRTPVAPPGHHLLYWTGSPNWTVRLDVGGRCLGGYLLLPHEHKCLPQRFATVSFRILWAVGRLLPVAVPMVPRGTEQLVLWFERLLLRWFFVRMPVERSAVD